MAGWLRQTNGLSVPVEAYPHMDKQGTKGIVLSVGGSTAVLSEEDAASLGGYLMGSTNNESDNEVAPSETVPQGGGI